MRKACGGLAILATLASVATPVPAQSRFIEDVRVAVDDDQALITLQFACEMRFVADTPTVAAALLEVRVAPFDSCARRGIGGAGETVVPIGAAAAHLLSVEFDPLGASDSLILLSFDSPLSYRLRQGSSLREIEVVVDLAAVAERRPLSLTVVEPETTPDYIINLQSTQSPVASDALYGLPGGTGRQLYVSRIRVDGVLWHRLRLGFFASEAEARAALRPFAERFPRAWIGRAEPAEIAQAREAAPLAGTAVLSFEVAEPAAADTSAASPAPLAADAIPAAMAQAREQLLDGENARAIELYSRLAVTPGAHRPEAIELLGLAHERNQEPVRAREQYQRWLREYPDDAARPRIEQRLASIDVGLELPRSSLRDATASQGPSWDFSSGLAQYYRRDDLQVAADQPAETVQSALFTDADFSLRRSGQRIDTLARLSFSHYHDLLDPRDGGRGDWSRIAYAYVDLAEARQQWSLRLGRQTLHTWGVLGRFDGAHASIGIGERTRLHLMTGFPVESTRDTLETDRQFAGLALEFVDLLNGWDLAAFLNTQSMEGIDARNAVGAEARYFDERRSITAMLDYDVDFAELNNVLVLGTLRLENRLTLSALLDQRHSPILSVRNALIGQPVETLDELLLVWTQEEVRRLAYDRTAQSRTLTLGLARPLGERLQLNIDLTSSEIEATPASGGVSASPGTGPQLFYAASLVGTGLMARNDVTIFSLRIGDLGSARTRQLTWDGRFPVGRRLRINPRIRLALWESLTDGRERQTVSPSLRLLINGGSRYRLELEVGRDEMTRRFNDADQDSNARFVNLGYRASF